MSAHQPIFYDSTQRRSKIVTYCTLWLCTVLVSVYTIGLWSIIRTPKLPAVSSAPLSAPMRTAHFISFQSASPGSGKPITAFYESGNEISAISLRRHLSQISQLVPDWLELPASGLPIERDTQDEQQVKKSINLAHAHPAVLPLLSDQENPEVAEPNFTNASLRQRSEMQLLQIIAKRGWSGITLDFQRPLSAIQESGRTLFVQELHAFLSQRELRLALVQPADPSDGQPNLVNVADQVFITVYDQHWSGGEAGAVADQGWVRDMVTERLTEASSKKYVFILGNYGYDWSGKAPATLLGFQSEVDEMTENKVLPTYDSVSGEQHFNYTDAKGQRHQVWYMDAISLYNQLKIMHSLGVDGVGLWELGYEDPTAWSIFGTNNVASLSHVRYDYDLRYVGNGDIERASATGVAGMRTVAVGANGLINASVTQRLPSTFTIQRFASTSMNKQIALTFDDGPDPVYTPEILDILDRYNVPATFFVIGVNASRNPDIVKRIYDDGNEIGNHTYYHSNVAMISSTQLRMEVSATQRVIESVTGHRTTLFRPPYAIDGSPTTLAESRPLQTISQLGYQTVNIGIDPTDWKPSTTSKAITSSILTRAKRGESNIVLLHDGGGDRDQTVQALPGIIRGLQGEGFSLVSVSTLLGESRQTVMPNITQQSQILGRVNVLLYWFNNALRNSLYSVFIISVVLGLLRVLGIASLAVRQRQIALIEPTPHFVPEVAIIIPAYNEEDVIVRTVRAALASKYGNFRVVVVDDGSTDATERVLEEQFGSDIHILSIPNGGKSQALNYAISTIAAEIVVTIDADTLIDPSAIAYLVRHFKCANVVAVAGNAKVGNRGNLLTRWQALEYVMGQNLDRRAFAYLNCICVVPGAIGAWRRSAILQAGCFSNETLAEDTDLTLQLLRDGGTITYEERAVAYTEAPEILSSFWKQRFRWVYGTIQAIWKHRNVLMRRRYRALGLVAIPNMLVFQIALPLLGPIMDLMMLDSIAVTIWQRVQHPESYSVDSVRRIFYYYIAFLALELVTGVIALVLERGEQWKLLFWLPVQRFFYRQVLYLSVIRSVVAAVRGGAVGWNKFARRGTVTLSG